VGDSAFGHRRREALMKTQISPVVATVIVVIAILAIGALIYTRMGAGSQQYGAKMPDVVAKEFQKNGPRPMPPVPMPSGATFTPQGGAVRPSSGAAGGN